MWPSANQQDAVLCEYLPHTELKLTAWNHLHFPKSFTGHENRRSRQRKREGTDRQESALPLSIAPTQILFCKLAVLRRWATRPLRRTRGDRLKASDVRWWEYPTTSIIKTFTSRPAPSPTTPAPHSLCTLDSHATLSIVTVDERCSWGGRWCKQRCEPYKKVVSLYKRAYWYVKGYRTGREVAGRWGSNTELDTFLSLTNDSVQPSTDSSRDYKYNLPVRIGY